MPAKKDWSWAWSLNYQQHGWVEKTPCLQSQSFASVFVHHIGGEKDVGHSERMYISYGRRDWEKVKQARCGAWRAAESIKLRVSKQGFGV